MLFIVTDYWVIDKRVTGIGLLWLVTNTKLAFAHLRNVCFK